jgi:predicted ATPase
MEAAPSVELTALAHHAAVAAPVDGGWKRAIEYTLAAGEQALTRRALDDAPRWFTESLALIGESPAEHEQERLRARCGLAEAQRDRREAVVEDLLDAGAPTDGRKPEAVPKHH